MVLRSRLPRRKGREKKHVSLRYRCGLPPPNPTASTGDFKGFIQNIESPHSSHSGVKARNKNFQHALQVILMHGPALIILEIKETNTSLF